MGTTNTEKRTQCPLCATSFSHRSSLMRHLRKKCNQPQPQTVRRKACTQCVTDKTRCNLKRPSCSRCSMRQIPCEYPYPTSPPSPEGDQTSAALRVEVPQAAVLPQPSAPATSTSLFDSHFSSDTSNWDLSLTGDLNAFLAPRRDSMALLLNDSGHIFSSEFINDLPHPMVPSPKPVVESPAVALANHSMDFIFRVLRSWPRMLADSFQTPPLIHHTQLGDSKNLPMPLANCFTLVKMWHGRCRGAEEMVHRLIVNELNTLLTKYEELDEPSLLAVLQAVVMYIIIILFPAESSVPTLPEANLFRKVQELVNYASSTGLFLQEEKEQTRPTWACWVHVTSKRRAVLALYLLHWAYAVFHNMPAFNCRELGFMPAPAAKILWHAQNEQEWNAHYIKWLARWGGEGYIQWEFERIRPGIKMEGRAEKWLEETDEFGMIMMSIGEFSAVEPVGSGLTTPANATEHRVLPFASSVH
ncbi:Zn(II)2Cys6 transcription factor domain-containing protein [Aspergillus lucknowensis]|uniref:Zn(2)-C6 fungal-type domain-containing protein n=1 Tax=Aspergillus lucknowensis TaxID=176173 RepID=A0ABR4M2L5_9EURO